MSLQRAFETAASLRAKMAVALGVTLAIADNTTIGGTLGITGNFAVNTNKFTVDASTGNTVVGGTLSTTGNITAYNSAAGITSIMVGTSSTRNVGMYWDNTGYGTVFTSNGSYPIAILANRVMVGTTTDNGADRLQVSGSASFTGNIIRSGYQTNNSQLQIGGLELQSYSAGNAWFGENVFYNGTAFAKRSAGTAGLFYFFGSEGQFRFSTNGSAGVATELALAAQLKIMADGTFAVGGNLNVATGNTTGYKFRVDSSGNAVSAGYTYAATYFDTAASDSSNNGQYRIGGTRVLSTFNNNLFVGNAGNLSLTGSNNTILSNAGANLTTGTRNFLVGNATGNNLANGDDNILIGYITSANTGSSSISRNVIIGNGAGGKVSTVHNNSVMVGHSAGANVSGTSYSNVIFLGYDAANSEPNRSNITINGNSTTPMDFLTYGNLYVGNNNIPATVGNTNHLFIGSAGAIYSSNNSGIGIAVQSNSNWNGSTHVARLTGASAMMHMNNTGAITFWTASSVSAGAALTYVDRLTIANNGAITASGSIRSAFATGSANPTTTDIPSGQSQLWKNTTSGEVRLWANDGGTLKSLLLA